MKAKRLDESLIKIEKREIPIPDKFLSGRRSTYGKCKWPFVRLKAKQSFFVEVTNRKESMRIANNIRSALKKQKKEKFIESTRTFAIRTFPNEVRVWRTK